MDFRVVAAKTAGQAYGTVVPFSGPAVEALVSDLLGVQKEELAVLRKLEASVQRLADVPWMSARIYLEDAGIPGRRPDQIRQSLEQANYRLHDAIASQQPQSPGKVDVRLVLSIVFAALGDQPASKRHAEIAYREARTAAWSLSNNWPRMNRESLLERRGAISSWYDNAEWTAAMLGDPQASKTTLGEAGFPWQAMSDRARDPQQHSVDDIIRWQDAAQLDFVYVAYAQALRRMRGHESVDEFRGKSLAHVMEAPFIEALPSPFQLQIEQEHRMGYFTGMED